MPMVELAIVLTMLGQTVPANVGNSVLRFLVIAQYTTAVAWLARHAVR